MAVMGKTDRMESTGKVTVCGSGGAGGNGGNVGMGGNGGDGGVENTERLR